MLAVAENPRGPTGGSAVIGGHVYRGEAYPELEGTNFVSDHSSGLVWGIVPSGGTWQMEDLPNTARFVTGPGEDESGHVCFTSYECRYGQTAPKSRGALWVPVDADAMPADATPAPAGPKAVDEEEVEEVVEHATLLA